MDGWNAAMVAQVPPASVSDSETAVALAAAFVTFGTGLLTVPGDSIPRRRVELLNQAFSYEPMNLSSVRVSRLPEGGWELVGTWEGPYPSNLSMKVSSTGVVELVEFGGVRR
jgi:hypothetical protein